MTLQVELVSPESSPFSGEADMVLARTMAGGDIAFLSGHVPFIGALAIHPVEIVEPGGARTRIAVHRGFVEVADDKVTILSDMAELPDDIDVEAARQELAAAEAALAADANDDAAKVAKRQAEVRLDVAGAATL
ncbi:MAG: ATP synthase F1 subunit epsilon [Actinomycetota bacterium]|nr:ATP synthase F1 subunit epsilon [Actinomycetota bacterium]